MTEKRTGTGAAAMLSEFLEDGGDGVKKSDDIDEDEAVGTIKLLS